MSQLKTNSITNISNTGDANITLNSDGSIGPIEVTGDIQSTNQNGGQLAGFRNQLINGDFRVWQRGISQTYAGSQYVADRWNCQTSASGGVNRQTAPQGLPCPFVMQFATNGQGFRQGIELSQNSSGDGLSGPFIPGSTWTISFYCNKDVSAIAPIIAFRSVVYDTAGEVRVDASPPDWSAVGSAISGFQRYKCTITIGAGKVPANGHDQLAVVFIPSSVNMQDDTRVTGCQFEPGPVATPFEQRPIQTELALCQRYYGSFSGSFLGFVYITSGGSTAGRIAECTFPVTMRTTPTVTATKTNWNTDSTVITVDRVKFEGTANNAAQTTYVTDVKADAEL